MRRVSFDLGPPWILALGYLTTIVIGGLLLWLPVAHDGDLSGLDAFFTATSATTVTGLVVVDTGTTFTTFGETVLMVLMQVGGLGLMTFAVLTALVLGRKVGLRQRLVFGEAMSSMPMGSVVRLVRTLLVFTVAVELLGTLLLATVWVPERGLGEGLYLSAFHSISSFNNAGFGLLSDNLIGYAGSPMVNVAITALFITGGIGFTVIEDLRRTRRFHDLALHTKLMLVGTLIVNVIAMIAILLLEYGNPNTIGNMNFGDKLWASWFQAVTPRTAGFNTLDTAAMTDSSLLLTILLMFIGAGSASTGSGIKLSTFIVIVLAVVSFVRGREETHVFERQIKHSVILRALAITAVSAMLVFTAMFALTVTEDAEFLALAFEATSAFGTVGLSVGTTPDLSTPGRLIIMVLMFIGRIGPLTLAFVLATRTRPRISYPNGEVLTG